MIRLFRIVTEAGCVGPNSIMVALVDCADALTGRCFGWRGISPTSPATTGMLVCLTRVRRQRCGQRCRYADRIVVHFSSWSARKVDGGMCSNGHWPFSSGVESCDWNMLASVVSIRDEADGIEYRIFLPQQKRDYKINDPGMRPGLCGFTWVDDGQGSVDAFIAANERFLRAIYRWTDARELGQPKPALCVSVFSLYSVVLSWWLASATRRPADVTFEFRGTGLRPTIAQGQTICKHANQIAGGVRQGSTRRAFYAHELH